MWLCASDSKCNQASVVIIDLYFVKSEADSHKKHSRKKRKNFQCFIDKRQNNIYKSKIVSTNISSTSTFSHEKIISSNSIQETDLNDTNVCPYYTTKPAIFNK